MNPMYLQEDHDWFISKAVISSHDTYGDLPVQTHKVGIGNSDLIEVTLDVVQIVPRYRSTGRKT